MSTSWKLMSVIYRGPCPNGKRTGRLLPWMTALIVGMLTLATPAWPQALPLSIGNATILGCTNDPASPGPNIGSVFTFHLFASGGQPLNNYNWSVTSGTALPRGLFLDPLRGVIEGDGTPSDMPLPGDYMFSLTVSDHVTTAQGGFTLHVDPDNPAVVCDPDIWTLTQFNNPPIDLGLAIPNRPFGASLPIEGGRAPWFMFVSGGTMPNGLQLNSTSGVVFGTPFNSVAPGVYTFQVQITDCDPATQTCGPGPSIKKTVTNAYKITVCQVGSQTFPCPQSTTSTHDFNRDRKSDLLWQNLAGPASSLATWLMNGSRPLQAAGLGIVPSGWSIVGHRDFDGDGAADLLWRDTNGNLAMWFMNGAGVSSAASLGNVPTNWTIFGTSDLVSTGKGALLWRDSNSGAVALWFMNGAQILLTENLGAVSGNWSIVGDDNSGDIFWRDTAGDLAVWRVGFGANGLEVTAASFGLVPTNWTIAGLGDFNGDGTTDILWRDASTGAVAIWLLNNALFVQSTASLGVVPTNWTVAQTGDYDGDGHSDILWIDTTGNVAVWFMNGAQISSAASLGNVGTAWSVQSLNAE